MPKLARPRHRLVWQVLEALNSELLASMQCFFGGGTRIVLELDEYRESMDVDFLCSDRAGYRALRSMTTQSSFGGLFHEQPELLREIRADMYGIRTFLQVDGQPLKFEIIAEGRIDLTGVAVDPFPIQLLDHTTCFAEKFLANADRGRDESTRSRDLIDLAFMSAHWPAEELSDGLALAIDAYGDAVFRELSASLTRFRDRKYRQLCTTGLAVSNLAALTRGLRALRKLALGSPFA